MTHAFILFHVVCATLGLLSGFLSLAFRKGSGLHRAAGTIFFVSMVGMTTSAAFIATFLRPEMINVVAASLTLYLVSTGRQAGRRRDGKTGIFDTGALLFILAVATGAVIAGVLNANGFGRPTSGVPTAMFFIFAFVALLCAVTDIRMLARGELSGLRRIARHVWRMSLAMLITTFSFYPGQAKLMSKSLRATNLLFVPHVLLIGSMIFWLVRISARRGGQRNAATRQPARPFDNEVAA